MHASVRAAPAATERCWHARRQWNAKAGSASIVHQMATPARFERATFPLGGGCSIQLSYGARLKVTIHAAASGSQSTLAGCTGRHKRKLSHEPHKASARHLVLRHVAQIGQDRIEVGVGQH